MRRRLLKAIGILSPRAFDWLEYHWHISWQRGLIYPDVAASMFAILGAKNKVAVDIGANLGIASRYLSKHFQHVHAVEPVPFLSHRLQHLDLPKVTVHPVGLGECEASLRLRAPVDDTGSLIHALTTGSGANPLSMFRHTGVVEFDAQQERLDTMAQRISGAIGYMKIDVEGAESMVLKGGQATIAAHRPLIQIEVERSHSADAGCMLALLNDWGYRCFSIDRTGLHDNAQGALAAQRRLIDLPHNATVSHQYDFLCIPEESTHAYAALVN